MNGRRIASAIILMSGAFALPALAQQAAPQQESRTEQRAENAGEAVTDAWITTKVKTDLLATENVGGTNIDVDTKKGVVTLTGTVKSQAEADKAVSVAKGIKGVTSVTSNLRVAGAANE